MDAAPVIPDYTGPCIANLIPALLQHREAGQGWIPDDVLDARQVVLLVIDGLGHQQLLDRAEFAPTLISMLVGPIDSVAPTTTSTALTSITTGTAPGEHGLIGYKIRVAGELLNALRWTSELGDARERIEPAELQPVVPFVGSGPVVVSQYQFAESGFTSAHLREATYRPYSLPSSLPVEIRLALAAGERFVYAYYDGIDKVAHITGLDEHYAAELAAVDAMVASVAASLPEGAALVVTADHGQVHVGDAVIGFAPEVCALTAAVSGEARFAWLHANGGRTADLLAAATEAHGGDAWIVPAERVIDEAWFGHLVTPAARSRLGDVAVVARNPVAFVEPGRQGPKLISRHGSLTRAEAKVPLATLVG